MRPLVFIALLAAPVLACAQMHMCKDAQGRKVYSDQPCGSDDTIVNVNPASGGTGINPGANVRTEHYDIRGTTIDELMREVGSKGPEGGWSGMTTSRLSFNLSWSPTKKGCKVDSAHVNYDAKIRLPNWVNRFDGSPQVQQQWDGIYRSLDLHERGHVQITMQGAQEMERQLYGIGEQPNCELLQQMAKERSQQVWAGNEQRQRTYDAETNHGLNQWTPYR